MEFLGAAVALGVVGLLMIGSILGIVSMVRTRQLERTLAALTAKVAALESRRPRPTPAADSTAAEQPAEVAHRPPSVEVATPAPAALQAARKMPIRAAAARPDLESIIAGRWLNRIGIVAMMLAASFFLKYAFDNNWIGPTGRVAIGLLCGIGLLILGQWLLGRGYRYFSEGIAALGGGVLFLSLYAAWSFYELIPLQAAFGGMAAVTAALAALAMGRDSERLAVLALAAGLTTPTLLIPDQDRQVALFAYLAILVACFLAVAWRKAWRWVAPVALAGTVFYFAGWYIEYYSDKKLLSTWLFATVSFAQFGAYGFLRARRRRGLHVIDLLLIPANAAWYSFVLFQMLYQDHRWWLTGALLALGAVHLVAARSIPAGKAAKVNAIRFVFAGLALTLVTSAIPVRLEGDWIVIAWSLEGALLVWAGFRTNVRALRSAGVGLLFVVIAVLAGQWEGTDRFLLNHRFAAFTSVVAALVVSARWARSRGQTLDGNERNLFVLVATAAYVVAVWGLSEELWNVLGRQPWDLDPDLARQMGLSLLWAIAAGLMILTGVRHDSKGRRWLGLTLLGFTVLKVFFLDLSFLDKAYRIASFLVLGVVLLVVSFWYQKSLGTTRTEDGDEDGEQGEGSA